MSLTEIGREMFVDLDKQREIHDLPSRWVVCVGAEFSVSSLDFLETYCLRVERITDFEPKDEVLLFLVDESQFDILRVVRDNAVPFGMTLKVLTDIPDSGDQSAILNILGHVKSESFNNLMNRIVEDAEIASLSKAALLDSTLTGKEFSRNTNKRGEVKHLAHGDGVSTSLVEPPSFGDTDEGELDDDFGKD